MAISFISKQKQSQTLALLVDIGSSSVGASFVKIEKGTPVNVVASVREDIPFQSVLSSQRFLLAMNHTLEKALKTLQSNTKNAHKVDQIFCTLSSPWFILKTRKLLISRPEEFEVNEITLEKFIDEDIALLKEELKDALRPQDVRIIEKKIIQMKLNGYEIKNPYKQRTSRMEMSTTIGVSSKKVIETIEHKVQHFFHAAPVHFGVFPVASFSTIRDIFPTEKNFVFLDITGETTDVSLVENDMLTGTISFPRGKNFFIREISSRLRTVHEEAATLFAMFLRDELDATRQLQVAEIVEVCKKDWLTRFEKANASLAADNVLPRKIFFTIDADIVSLFSPLIAKIKPDFLEQESFDVQYLDQLIISKFVTFEAEVVRDPFIVVEALFAEKIIGQHN